ncbi:uncharacterized protein [Branchiostoma lanceolatum]|uniref:uncharacterized protein n=1 Tax=Branchiostoma lanceolatum TaxID=7740 RepID=UPI0034539F22
MLRVCEKLREVDAKGRRYGLTRAETGYLRALVDAMADMDRLAEVELLKSLGDVNVEKGRLGKAEGEFNRALALYMAAVVRCDHREQGEGLEHRYEYTEKLLQRVSSKGSNGKDQPTEDKETTTPAKVAGMFQDLDNKWATGGNTDSVLVGYAQLMVEGIVDENNMLETEAIKSLGDVYLKRGTIIRNMTCLTRASALYNTALARCNNVQGTRVIAHRLLHTAKIWQDITTTEAKRSTPQRQEDVRGRKDHPPPFSAAPSSDVINDGISTESYCIFIDFIFFCVFRVIRRCISCISVNSRIVGELSLLQPSLLVFLFSFYRRYFKEASLELGNGDLDAAEQSLEAALKLIHDPSKPDKAKEADCLCRLGDVYVERGKRTGEDVTYDAVAADKMTKCCNLRKKMLQAAGLVIVIVIFFLLPYFAVKVATISADVAKLSEELAILSDTMAKLNSMAQLRFAKLEREIVS